MLRYWRTQLGYTQKELAEVLRLTRFYIGEQERGAMATTDRTLHQTALLYSIHSLPPDAPVSILQEMLIPPTLAAKRAKARERLERRQAARSKTSKRSRRKR